MESEGDVKAFTSGQLADPLVFGVTGLWHESVVQVTVHSTVPPVVLLVLVLYEGCHHLHRNRQETNCNAYFSPVLLSVNEAGGNITCLCAY